MTSTDVILIVAAVAIVAGLIMARVRRRSISETERIPPPVRDID